MIRQHRQHGFTLVELLFSLFILAMAVALLIGVSESVRTQTQTHETRRLQRQIQASIQAYHAQFKEYPPGNGGPDSTAALLTTLNQQEEIRAELDLLPMWAVVRNDEGRPILLDAFGRPMEYNQSGGLGRLSPLLLSLGPDVEQPNDNIKLDIKER